MLLKTISVLALSTAALADTVTLKVKAKDGVEYGYAVAVDGDHSRQYFIVGEQGSQFSFKNNELRNSPDVKETSQVGFIAHYLTQGPMIAPSKFFFNSDDMLQTAERFWMCKQLNDPMKISESEYMLVVGEDAPGVSCAEVELQLETIAENVYLAALDKGRNMIGTLDSKPITGSTGMVILSEPPQALSLVYKRFRLTHELSTLDFTTISAHKNFLMFSATHDTLPIMFDDENRLVIPNHFWACKDVNDPNGFSKTAEVIMYAKTQPGKKCSEIYIEKVLTSNNARYNEKEEKNYTQLDGQIA